MSLIHNFRDIQDAQKNWGWFFALGALLVLLGIGVASCSYYATIFSVFLFGIFLLGAGIVQLIQSSLAAKWSGVFLSIFLGILYLVTGFLCVTKPTLAAISITLWVAAFCFVVGLFRMIASIVLHAEQWGWAFFNGLITFFLGAVIYADWPISGLWLIGLFIGIDLVLAGWTWIVLAIAAKNSQQ